MIRNWLRKWLGVSDLHCGVQLMHVNAEILSDEIKKAKALYRSSLEYERNKAIIGVDLRTRGDAELILIQYNKATGGIKVIASEQHENPIYQNLIRRLRSLVNEANAEFLIIDRPKGIADIETRVWCGLNSTTEDTAHGND